MRAPLPRLISAFPKLVGAGGSGFLLFHTHDRRRLRSVMTEAGVHEMDFSFDFDGSVVITRS
jgi:D-glycero-alpha-D-manno-heptose-7-phosphate kinase